LPPFVKNRTNLLQLDLIANRYGQRPSAILGVADEWAAYQLDFTVAQIAVRHEVDALRNRSGRRPAPPPPAGANGKSGYRSPMELSQAQRGRIKRMKIPESGVW
jgi:hypothetical protein